MSLLLLLTELYLSSDYVFSNRTNAYSGRDVFNEKPTEEERQSVTKTIRVLQNGAIIRTTLGDIHLKLFPDQ
jgi:peptidylprolyl isomerase domain and WD repeat-containing protein 1